jgi:hypothetical protein
MDMDMDMDMDEDMYSGDSMMGGSSVATVDPADNRYVNAKNEPVTGSALRSALTSNSASDAEIAVAKRVPVMMALQIDQRYIQELLAKCGSAPLMIQVKQVRILPKEGLNSLSGGSGMMGMDEMDEGMDMDMEMDMGMESGMGMGGMGMGMAAAPPKKPPEPFPLDMAVELYGLIYMYNPPDPVKLGVEEVDKDTVIDGVTESKKGEPVAAAPPAEVNDVLPTPPSTATAPAAPTTEPAPAQPAPAQPGPAQPGPAQPPAGATVPGATNPSEPPPAGASPPPVAEAGSNGTPPPAIILPLP